MAMTDSREIPAPPRLIPALVAGFDAITNHISLILFPLVLDLLIWFAPHLRLEQIITSLIDDMVRLSSTESVEVNEMLSTGRDVWAQIAGQINLSIALRSYPVGVPSLLSASMPLNTPLGTPVMIELPSFGAALLVLVGLTVLGIIFGTLFYLVVTQAALDEGIDWIKAFSRLPAASLQSLFLALIWLVLFAAVTLPASCLISLIALGGLPLGQISFLLLSGFLIWLLIPLLFSAHGIFILRISALQSIKRGVQITNRTLPTTMLFFGAVFLLTRGLDILWRLPAEDSWLTLLGILGHAFITTGLLSASFIYYQGANHWVSEIKQKIQQEHSGNP